MQFLLKTLKKSTILVLLAIFVISSFVVYAAYIDRTVYTTERLVIIPDSVSSDSWLGLNSVLVQDISEYSLYQDFTEKNSAYISELGIFSREGGNRGSDNLNDGGTTSPLEIKTETEANSNDVDSSASVESTEGINSTHSVDEPISETEPEIPGSTEPNNSSSEIAPSADVSYLMFPGFQLGLLPKATPYLLAQGIIDEPAVSEPVADSSSHESSVEVVETSSRESVESTVEEAENAAATVTKTIDESTGGTATDSTNINETVAAPASASFDETLMQLDQAIPADEANYFTLDPCLVESGCQTHSMLFTGFALPDFESGTVLDSAQLRLSLAAQTKQNRSAGPQRYIVEYSYETGTSSKNWQTASVIDIDEEISNSINGGYFLLTLDTPRRAGEIANLQIRISYQGDVTQLERAFVEGVWLEVTSGTFYEKGDTDPYSDILKSERDLRAPELNTLDNASFDPTLGVLPSFTLSYDPQQNFFSRIFNRIFAENTFAVDTLALTDASGNRIEVPFEVVYHENNIWTVTIKKQPQALKPGTYTISATMLENEVAYVDSFEFYWGLLAVNTKKSMYFPNEKVEFNLAALTNDGKTICNADLHLQIIDPKNTIFDVPVEQSGACGPDNVTDIPDYIAKFADTGEWGVYTVLLENRNIDGKVVHKVQDSFEVRDYIPFDIERTAPTRIYPPSPYAVNVIVTAYRDFTGDINERVPRGFVIENTGGALISTLPEYTLITWKDISLKAGETINLSYTFDAPDISPYMYLLGPLDMDGFAELRQWQIASDALGSIGWFTGTRSVGSTNLNNTASALQWATSSIDNFYFTHSTTSSSERVTIRQAGDYFISVNVPQQRTDGTANDTRVGVEVRINGVAAPQGLGRSAFIGNAQGQNESSGHTNFMLTGMQANDYVEVFVAGLTTINGTDIVTMTGQASMFIEYIPTTSAVFAATSTATTNSVNLNQVTAYPLSWIETRQDTEFVHSDTVTPQNITISNPGTYLVQVSVPLTSLTADQSVLGRVLLDGTQVSGGIMSQGYIAGVTGDNDASIHWSGVVVSTTTNQVLTIATEREGAAGTTSVPTGFVGSILIQAAPASSTIILRGRNVSGGTDWSNTPAERILWDTRIAYDASTFTHSTTTSNDRITIASAGDYLLTFSDALTSATANANSRITVTVSSTTVSGAQVQTHYISGTGGHNNSSGNFNFLLTGLTVGQFIQVYTEQEGRNATLDDTTDAILTITKKAAFNQRPAAPSMFNVPFDNIRFASTTPYFEFQSSDPDGTSDIQYEFALATSSDFATATVRVSGTHSGFLNTASTTDTSPFLEGNKIRFQLQSADTLSDLATYYWRVRAKDATGSGQFGDWSTTQSLTVDLAATVPNWYQTLSGQFSSNVLVGAVSTNNSIQVAASVISDVMLVYGEGVVTTPRYRIWNGTSWNAEASAIAVSNTINWVVTAAGVSRDEYALVTLDQSNDSYAQIYSASTSSWGNQTLLSSVVSSNAYRGAAVAYESLSGDAMAVSCTNGPDPVFRIWNGSSWSATSTINASSVNNCNFIAIASDPASDEIIVVVRDTGTQYEALIWNGSTWVDSRVIGTSALVASEGMSVAYESSGDQAVITVSNNTNASILYTTWNGTEWSANTTQPIGNDFVFGRLTADPNSDKLVLCYIDADADVGALRWDGGVWSPFFELTTTGNAATGRPVSCDFETLSGRSGYIMAAYGDTGVDGDYHQTFVTSTWSGPLAGSNINDAFWVQTARAGDGTIIGAHLDDENDRLDVTNWNGTSWSNLSTLETSPSSIIATPYEMYSLSAKRFQFTQGVARTPVINFSFVANQPRWGDISFSTTEPFGTDVLVRVRYTASTTCDTYIPNAALAGNSAGFDVSSAPIDLTSLSTTTYSQICLEATLTTLGSASASLDDWILSWVRKPRLIQQAYRWYVNGSFLTPTDAWPAGGIDVAESMVLNSEGPVNINQSIRLRMSIRGSNVILPISTSAFKLQYAPGVTCSPTLVWADVGSPASTTALWRGYSNTISGGPDGTILPTRLLTESDTAETYEETNPTNVNASPLPIGNDAEWDFALENRAATVGTNYCFRLVYADGATLNSYTNYPRLITNAPPLAPNESAPFDNEQLASTTPWFEFAATDEASDVVSYEIEVDNDYDFSSPVLNRNSVSQFSLFTNIVNPAERSQYTSGQTIRFIPNTSLSNNTTYWWRVRAKDDFGSNTSGDWSTPHSFRVATATAITTWFQTTGEQFDTDSLIDTTSSTSTNDLGISTGLTAGTTTSSVIDYDDRETGNAWGQLSWTDNEAAGTIKYLVEYRVSGETFALIPDGDLPGNSSGFNTSPVSLISLNTATYNELRVRAVFAGTDVAPRLLDWTVTWGLAIEIPTLVTLFDNAKVATTTPTFTFYTTDPESNDLQYEFQLSSSSAFTSSSTFVSGVNAGFSNLASSTDTSPFVSGNTIQYIAQSALVNGSTYWWRVRARDPGGSNTWSGYVSPKSFTVDTAITVSAWFQTTGDQFQTNTLSDIQTTAGGAQITSTVNKVLMAYGEGTGQAPRYRIWNGAAWGTASTGASVGAQIRFTQLKAAPTRPEYALGTLGTDADVNVQIYQTQTDTWGNIKELDTALFDTQQRGFDLAYETTSGDLVAVSCRGLDAVFSVWNGSSWTATSSIALANANNCLYVEMASDPISDELIAVFKHSNTSAVDYETLVWNGSSWGNSSVFGDMVENANEGIAVEYEESGGQAIVGLSNGALTTLIFNIWNGATWAGATSTPLGDHIEWASLKRDQGTDALALCYIDNDTNIGVLQWSGSAWGAFAEIELLGNSKAGQPVDCEYETLTARNGYLLAAYSDTGAAGAGDGGKYQVSTSTSFGGELDLDTIEDSWRVVTARGGDGIIHAVFFDDTNDRYDVTRWNGTTWNARQTISTIPSIIGTPFDGSLTIAAQIYPNFTIGTILSTPIRFADGSGPRWERLTWSDTTPALSDIRYRLYYQTASSTYALVPDSALTGNATGFTTSPVSIANVDRTVYSVLKMQAELICNSGTCPTIQDWSLEWSQGINVSGTAYEYNGTTTVPSGTIAVAVNGVLQSGKTATIGGLGTWSIPNVTAFSGDSITVFIDGAADSDEAVGIATYDGVGDVTQMELSKRTVTFGSTDIATTTNSMFGAYDTSDDEDVFFSVTGSSSLLACGAGSCGDAKIKIKSTAIYQPGGNVTTLDINNQGRFLPESNTIRVAGSWTNTGTFIPSLSTVIFSATTSAHTITSSSTASSTIYHNVTFGETSGTASWTLSKPLDITGTLAVDYGTLVRGTSTINLEQNLRIGASGSITGLGTTTFDGSGSHTWTDSTASSTNLGYVVIDGSTKTITLGGNVTAQSVTIGSDDTLNASGSGFNINVYTAWTNNNSFIPQSGTVTFIGTTTGTIARGASAFNNLTFNGVGSSWSFATSTLVVNNNLTIATGTVTLPSGTTTVAGNFTNSGGTFLHNNGEVRMTSTASGKTIMQRATAFLNAFYDLTFTGSGAWSYTESAASTTRNYQILSGTVTMPSTSLTVGGDFAVTGAGVFAHNSGEIILLLQAANSVRANGSNFNNLRTSGSGAFTRTFTDTTATILGNLLLDTGGTVTFPTGVLSIGGSFDNNATFNNSGGTVRFNSTAGAKTIAMGASSTFATLEFNSVTGDFTVIENATATVAIALSNASQFTVQSGLTLAALGTFTNAVTASSTTWTGSTLSLSGVDGAINAKTHGGDTYGTLLVNGDTDMIMWNSSAGAYTTASTASIYSADHAVIDGDLNIYGDYVRATGTEHWSFATDFDGTALTASTSRQVDVRVASSATIGLTSASLNMVGSAAASTTINAIAGSYTLSATTSTITASYFTVAGTNASGLQLNASTTLASFQDGFFTVVPGRTGITISSTTVSQNPAAQYSRISFATTTAGSATNVTQNGVSNTFVWFRLGTGNLYGEAFDANDGNPGSIRFDDSSNTITISGVVYADDGVTPLGSPTCDGTTPNVRVVVNNGSYTASTTCAAGTGAYTLTGVAYVGDPKITVYLNTNGGVAGSVVTKTPTANITNLDIYANRVITRHQDVTPLSIPDMTTYDNDDDTDIKFTATTTGTTSLTVLPASSLYVFASTTFAPSGNVTLLGNASTSAIEGTLQLGNNATFTAAGTETHTLAGRLVLATTSILTSASSTFVFNATTTGKSITSSNTITFNNVQFAGVAGGWNITAPLIVNGNMDVATGTVTGTNNLTLTTGSLSGNGTLSFGSGTTTINQTNTFGGTRAWTFNNLVLGSGSVVGTTTRSGTATTTILGRLTINNAHFLVAGNSNWDLAGAATVFVESGTLVEDTSTFRYSGASSQVLATTYYNLDLNAGAGTPTYTATGIGIGVTNNLTVGGAATTVFDVNTNDPALVISGSVTIASNGTLSASNIATTSVGSNFTNLGTFTSNNGIVAMVGSGASTIAAGNSSFATLVINNALGSFTQSQNATTTVAFTLLNHANYTLASGQTMAIGGTFTNTLGGAATTFATTTLSFYGGGTKNINAKTVSDVYHTLFVASSTNVKMWNSSATNYTALGGIYSQDHASVDGKLNIYGAYTQSSGNDYWNYATDFDGVALGGSSRRVDVAFASSSSALYSGGGLEVVGISTASTTLANQGAGTYGLVISGNASTSWNTVVIRNINASGTVMTGTPTIGNFSRTDHLVEINGGTGITVGGTVIDVNQAKNFTNNTFASSSGVTGAINVTATGTSVSSWRFTNHQGALSGEAFDSDPAGDPGYLVWDNSAALITISGNVYSDEGTTVSTVCNGITPSILLRVAGLTTYTTSCSVLTGAYSIPNVAFSPADTLTVYIDNFLTKAVTISADPISSISNMHLYENRVIVRHENTSPLTIAKMVIWDSSDDVDIMFTATDAATDTLSLPADQKLLIWNGKTFEPNGNVTLAGGGGGGAQDGTLEAQANATFRAIGTETHSIGGSMIFGAGATYTTGLSTTTFTTTGASRTIDVNSNPFYNVAVTGAGSYTVADSTFTTSRSLTQSNGAITFGSGTTTIGASLNATAGSFTMAGTALLFTSTTTGNIVRFDDSVVPAIRFSGTGGAWSMTDTNATTTGAFTVASGTVTLPSGNLAVARNFENLGGTIVHNTADIYMTATSSALLSASSSSLFAVRFTGVGPFTIGDINLTLADSLTLATGTLTLATGTLGVAGDFLIASGTANNATGTVLLNATVGGKLVKFGTNALYNVVFGSGTGGWTLLADATTTNNFSITGAGSFTKETGTTLHVGGVFTNLVGGSTTTWATTTLRLYGVAPYTINTKTTGDVYGTLQLATSTAIRSWNSNAATATMASSSSWYSQDHNAVDGALWIYGDFAIATTTEYWNYATDFDGAALSGPSQRAVSVRFAQNATTTLQSGGLQLIGVVGATTSVAHQATGTYALIIQGGTFNAQYYSLTNLNVDGLKFNLAPTVTNLSNGYYNLSVASGSLMTVATTVLDTNASKVFTAVGFNATGPLTGYNVQLIGSTSNAWRFSGSYGNIGTESFDIDGITACGSIRFDSSGCLLTQQTNIRWRNDNGGEGAPTSEWYNTDFTYRKRVRVANTDSAAYANTAVKINVTYDSIMQSDFDDLRFTAEDGLTVVPYWIERYTASTDATVWVKVPTIPASGSAEVFMYFGSSTALTLSSGTSTFSAFDDFEDNNITEYSGDTSLFQTDTTPVYGGVYALEALNKSARTPDGIFRTAMTVSQGQIIRWMQYLDTTAGSGDEACTLFGVQSPGTNNNNYAVCLEQFGIDRVAISKNVVDNDVSGTVLASSTATYTTGWYEVEVDWNTDNTISAYVRTAAGAFVATTSVTDATYTTGGTGFTFWFQNGSWDSYTARPRAMINPSVYFGAKQSYGGASWSAAQNAAGGGAPGDTKRLRIAVENSGLDVTGQLYRLEFAGRGVAPSCEAVPTGSFAVVPNQASCGSSPVCMQTSSQIADSDPTTDLLASTTGTFSAGRMVESPSSAAISMDLNQNRYTELEYVLTPTVNATSSYCFRVTNAGTPLDYYSKIAELSLSFDPVFGAVTLNNGFDITLTPGTTTTIYATGTVTDLNGAGDIVSGSSTIYRSGAGPGCSADTNNCYKADTTASSSCSIASCSGNTCTLSCRADVYFNADATDVGAQYEGQKWSAYLEVRDAAGGYDFASAIDQELITLQALSVDSAINYGSLAVSANTGAFNPTTSVANIGNIPFNIELLGTDLSDGAASRIPANQQKFATSSFTYSSCIVCSIVSSTTPVTLALALAKPTVPNPPVIAPVYWGIQVPIGVRSTAHSGTTIFTPVPIP